MKTLAKFIVTKVERATVYNRDTRTSEPTNRIQLCLEGGKGNETKYIDVDEALASFVPFGASVELVVVEEAGR